MSRRDVALTIALAIAKDGLPVPDEIQITEPRPAHELGWYVTLNYTTRDDIPSRPVGVVLPEAAEAARILGLGSLYTHPDGFVWDWSANRHGWHWAVTAHVPRGTLTMPEPDAPPDPLAEQVIAAIGGAA